MILLALVSHVGFGAWFAWTFQRARSLYHDPYPWPLLLLLLIQGWLILPLHTFLIRFHADWWTSYWLDPDIHPWLGQSMGWISLLQWLLGGLLAYLGFMGLIWSQRQRWHSMRYLLLLGPYTLGLIWAGILGPKVALIGSFEQFQLNQARWFLQSLAGWLWILSLFVPLLYMRWCYRRWGTSQPSWW